MYLMDLTMNQFQAALKDVDTAILPIGMVEAHGNHCPLGTDMLIPRHFMELLENRMGEKLIIAPEVPYGHSWVLKPFPGTINLPSSVFKEYVLSIGIELGRWGITKLVLFNGHGGNIPALTSVMEGLADAGIACMLINWWQDFREEILTICSGQGHGGEDETAAVLAIDPGLVDMGMATVNSRRLIAEVRFPGMGEALLPTGQSGDATKATPQKGEAIYAALLPKIEDLIHRLQSNQLFESK